MIAATWAPARIGAPRAALIATGLFGAVAAVTVAVVVAAPQYARAGHSLQTMAAEVAVAAGLLLAAVAAHLRHPRPRYTLPLAALAIAWLAGEWNSPGAGPVFTAGLLLYAAWPVLVAVIVFRGPDQHGLGRAAVTVLAVGAITAAGLLGVASALVFDPRDQGCLECPVNLLLVHADASAWRRIGDTGLWLTAAWTGAAVITGAAVLARSSPARRRIAAPVMVPGLAVLALCAIQAVAAFGDGYLASGRRLVLAQTLALGALAAGALWERGQARRTRSRLARLVVELFESATPEALEQRFSAVLRDPALRILYAAHDGHGQVDGHGRPAVPGAAQEVTWIVARGERIAALAHRPGLLADRASVREITAATRLALDHARWQALQRAELAELQASRARVVEAADRERRRLERDLHDGAQQALVTLAVNLRLARRRSEDPALASRLATAEDDMRASGAELRTLAHGLFPAALDEEGLAAAIEALADQEPRLRCAELADVRVGPAAASAIYFVVAQALRRSPGAELAVRMRCTGGRLVVTLRSTRPLTVPSTDFEDRIGAAGGTLAIDGHTLQAEVACAS
jgi:signal transduction histidine kinase